MKKWILFLATVMNSITLRAEIIFDASQVCQSVQTESGTRYRLPCTFSPTMVEPLYLKNLPDFLDTALYKTTGMISFECQTLRPLSINYQFIDDGVIVGDSTIGSNLNRQLNNFSFVNSYGKSKIHFTEIQTTNGIQAIRPGCVLSIDQVVSTPELSYFELLTESITNFDKSLSRIIVFTSPSATYAEALGYLEQAIFILEFLENNVDEITAKQISETINGFNETKNAIIASCGAGVSGTSICPEAIGKVRQVIESEVESNKSKMKVLKEFYSQQIEWMKDKAYLERDKKQLEELFLKIGID